MSQGPDATPLLDPAAGPVDAPIRSVLFGQARFEQHGQSLAETHEVVAAGVGSPFFPRLSQNIETLQRAGALLDRQAREGLPLGPAAAWLLDNASLIEAQLRAIRTQLPRRYFRRLPVLRDPPLEGLPRIYGVAWAWVAHTDSSFDAPLLEAYLLAYQRQRQLTLAELWALPTTLRAILVENLRRLAERGAVVLAAREWAHAWIDEAISEPRLADLENLHAKLAARDVTEAFALPLHQRLDELASDTQTAVSAWLSQYLPDPASALARQQAEFTSDHQSVRNAIISLRQIDQADWREIVVRCSTVIQTLQRCPVFAAESEGTQDETLHAVEALAREGDMPEATVAAQLETMLCAGGETDGAGAQQAAVRGAVQAALQTDISQHAPAYWWQGAGRPRLRQALGLADTRQERARTWLKRHAAALYVGGVLVATLGVVVAMVHGHQLPLWGAWLAALLLLAPASEAVVALVNRLISESARPAHLPRLALADGVPVAHQVLVVLPALLSSQRTVAELAATLERHHLANRETHAQFALLSDWRDAPAARSPQDEHLLETAQSAIAALNQRHPIAADQPNGRPRFLLLHRARVWSESERCWMGWERKRGKIESLVRAIAEPGHKPFVDLGGMSDVHPGTRHILALDTDTGLPPGRLRELVSVAAHPLNQPVVDPALRRVTSGYGILQPRVLTPLPSAVESTGFHWLFNGHNGIDPYSAASSETYQDLFDEGSFTGKGLLHVHALHQTLVRRFPDEQVLSHDLIEGCIARCARVSDVTVVEQAPAHPDVANSRLHRWTRGDWQLVPFLLQPQRYALNLIGRWKMFDNLRRTLVAPLSLAALMLAAATPLLPVFSVLALLFVAFAGGPLLGALAGLLPGRNPISWRLFLRHAGAEVLRAIAGGLWQLVQLLNAALLYADAIGRAVWRTYVSRHQLLEWTTAAAAQAAASTDPKALLLQHANVPVAAIVLAGGLAALHSAGYAVDLPWGVALCAVWALSPLATAWAARPLAQLQAAPLAPDDQRYLEDLARDSWRHFASWVGTDDNHLPPDNVQTTPHTLVAHRTSPTNIGLYMLAVACAREFGWIGTADMAERIEATMRTLDRLPRHHGHFFNWYDTQTLGVLPPAYVSTVDSGNFSGALLAVARACEERMDEPLDQRAMAAALAASTRRLQGVQSVLLGPGASGGTAAAPQMLALLALDHPLDSLRNNPLALRRQIAAARLELDGLWHPSPWADAADGAAARAKLVNCPAPDGPAPDGEAKAQAAVDRWKHLLTDHLATLDSAAADAALWPQPHAGQHLCLRLQALAERMRQMAWAAEWALLYDKRRALLHIGLRADTGRLDNAHYDLLASEARLTSLLAIAKGELPPRHWAALGRPVFAGAGQVGLRSWSGSMFEYLMPSLLLTEPAGGLLNQALHSALDEQLADGLRHQQPWGLSECAYAGQDHTLAYQYGPQGVARLALRRTPPDERVVAPYASVLASLLDPTAAAANLRRMQDMGARGHYGFIEALDFTLERQSEGSRVTLVSTVMSHHQGMGLVALTAVLRRNAPRRWAMSDAHIDAVSSLLHERPPREAAPLADPVPPRPLRRARPQRLERVQVASTGSLPPTQLLGNGRYAVGLRSHGGGWSQWQGVGVTRWRDDALRDEHGSFFFIQRDGAGQVHSLTHHPAPDPAAAYRSRFGADRVVFETRWPDLQSKCEVWVSPEDDVELRRIELHNRSDKPLALTLHSYQEITLSDWRADEAHPAFANLFVRASWQPHQRALYLERQPRLHGEPGVHAVHFLAAHDTAVREGGTVESLRAATDRARWIGRYRTLASPLAAVDTLPAADAVAADGAGVERITGLDPIAALAVRVRIKPHASITLTFATAAAAKLETLDALVDKYRQPTHIERAADMSHTMAGIRLRERQIDPDAWNALLLVNTALSSLLARDLPPLPATAEPGRCDRRSLWRYGISGERPLLVVWIAETQGLALVQTLARALQGWAAAALAPDLVVINAEAPSYLMPVQNELQHLMERHRAEQDDSVPANRRASLSLLRAGDLEPDALHTLHALARMWLRADGRPLPVQVERWAENHMAGVDLRSEVPRSAVEPTWPPRRAGAARRPAGRFSERSGAFAFGVGADQHPSKPWVNVLANAEFGTQISDSAGGYTWGGNSRLHQLTAWSNDPVSDPSGETLLLQDLDTRQVWRLGSPLADGSTVRVEHGPGITKIVQQMAGLEVELHGCVDAEHSVKQVRVVVRQGGPTPAGGTPPNAVGAKPRRLRLVALAEWIMGGARYDRISVLCNAERVAASDNGNGGSPALLATQCDHYAGFGGSTAWLALRHEDDAARQVAGSDTAFGNAALHGQDWTCDRREFFDSRGRMVLPDRLAAASGAGLDPCAALGTRITLRSGDIASVAVLLGHALDPEAARALLRRALPVPPRERQRRQQSAWDQRLGAVSVQTPDPLFDALVNRWLPYQTLACRLWARAGFYQAGGAFGFRDQLQDAASMLWHDPALLRKQLLMAASRQFPEGDVQHWWHMPGGAGVRTHFSDDLLWMPWACAGYVQHTGDHAVLDEDVAFLDGQAVPPGAEDVYETPRTSAVVATLYEHCARAIDHKLDTGAHGLPLMGTGDWNDGMNRVGNEGRGESVWLAWFLCRVVRDFSPVATARGDMARVHRWALAMRGWQRALETHGWDGAWYRRAFFDDGSPLGASANAECKIDLIAQAWSLLSDAGEPQHVQQALDSARTLLLDGDNQLVRLLDPPLRDAEPSAGYIQAYPGGVRENGGQYNHGAVWALMAFARQGDGAAAWAVFKSLSPAHRDADAKAGAVYAIEPYVMAGDIYTQPPYVGRGGWSWYTGSAGWLLRAAIESMLGATLQAGKLRLAPCLPPHWPRASLRFSHHGRQHRVLVCRDEAEATKAGAELRQASKQVDGPVDGQAGRHVAGPLQPQRHAVGDEIDLAALPDGSVIVVVIASAQPAAVAVGV